MSGLAGGLAVGDRVACNGLAGTVVGGPARAACVRLSVAVRYDDGRIADERVQNLELLVEELDDDEDRYGYEAPAPAQLQFRDEVPPPVDDAAAARALWSEPDGRPSRGAPRGLFAGDDADEASPDDSRDQDPRSFPTFVPERPDVGGDSPEQDPRDFQTYVPESIPGNSFGPGTDGYGPDEAEEAVRRKIYANYEDLRAAFRALDQSNNGYVTREDFFQAMGNIFLNNGFSEDDVYEVADRFDLNKDGYISYNEFVAVVEGDAEAQAAVAEEKPSLDDPTIIKAVDLAIQKFKSSVDRRYNTMRHAFLALDTSRSNALSPQNFAKGLVDHGIFLSPPELQLAWSLFDQQGTGKIAYTDFCAVMTQRLQFGSHLGRQMFKSEPNWPPQF